MINVRDENRNGQQHFEMKLNQSVCSMVNAEQMFDLVSCIAEHKVLRYIARNGLIKLRLWSFNYVRQCGIILHC